MKKTPLKRTAFKRKPAPTPRPYRRKPKPPAILRYWDVVAGLGCIVTGRTDRVTIHHVHGGSIRGVMPRGRGVKQDWMVIPLDASLHTAGPTGIDTGFGVLAWEEMYGTQLQFLLEVMRRTGVDPFKKSGLPWPEGVDKPMVM
jgi:hypothetical protein